MMAEMPVAQLTALMANVNRDPKKSKAFGANDFRIFRPEGEGRERSGLSAVVAAVALELRHQQRAPEVLLTIWPEVLKAAKDTATVPRVRALHCDDQMIWVLAPQWEGRNVRGGLVLVRGRPRGSVRLRDIDRPLLTYDVVIPQRGGYGWIAAEYLLQAAS